MVVVTHICLFLSFVYVLCTTEGNIYLIALLSWHDILILFRSLGISIQSSCTSTHFRAEQWKNNGNYIFYLLKRVYNRNTKFLHYYEITFTPANTIFNTYIFQDAIFIYYATTMPFTKNHIATVIKAKSWVYFCKSLTR